MKTNQEFLKNKTESGKTLGSVLATLNDDQRVAVFYLLNMMKTKQKKGEGKADTEESKDE